MAAKSLMALRPGPTNCDKHRVPMPSLALSRPAQAAERFASGRLSRSHIAQVDPRT